MRPQSAAGGRLKHWAPPIIWMSMIFWFSTDLFSADNTGSLLSNILSFIYPGATQGLFDSIHFYVRKAAHLTEYAVLALLLFRAFRSGSQARWRLRWAISSVLFVFLYASLDEYHQTFTRRRTGSVYDILIDTSGAAAALILLWLLSHRATEPQSGGERGMERKRDGVKER